MRGKRTVIGKAPRETPGKQSNVLTVLVTCEQQQMWVAGWLQPLVRGSSLHWRLEAAQKAAGSKSVFPGVHWLGCANPGAQAYPPTYLLELSFHAASCTRTAGDKGGPWPSTVLTVLG